MSECFQTEILCNFNEQRLQVESVVFPFKCTLITVSQSRMKMTHSKYSDLYLLIKSSKVQYFLISIPRIYYKILLPTVQKLVDHDPLPSHWKSINKINPYPFVNLQYLSLHVRNIYRAQNEADSPTAELEALLPSTLNGLCPPARSTKSTLHI